MSEEMKRFLQEELKKEANEIMREVDADQDVESLTAPSKIDEKLYEQIRQYKEEQEVLGEKLSTEQQELIRLGKIYKRKQKRRKYVVLAAAVMAAFAVGITSVGGPERIFRSFHWKIGDREQTNFDSDNEDIVSAKVSEEEEAYQRIKDEFGFDPVRMLYLPKDIRFQEGNCFREMQSAQMIYGNHNMSIRYEVNVNYNDGSIGVDIENKVTEVKRLNVKEQTIEIKKYDVDGGFNEKFIATFKYEDIQYFITGDNVKESEFEKILKNLKFF